MHKNIKHHLLGKLGKAEETIMKVSNQAEIKVGDVWHVDHILHTTILPMQNM
jgi:hypothetical protein